MKLVNFSIFDKWSLNQQIKYLLDHNLFHISDPHTIDEILIDFHKKEDDIRFQKIQILINDYRFIPNKFYSNKLLRTVFEFENSNFDDNLFFNFKHNDTQYLFETENLSSYDEKIKFTVNYRNKIIKFISTKPYPFLKHSTLVVITRSEIKEAFSNFWKGTLNKKIETVEDRYVNIDILDYLTFYMPENINYQPGSTYSIRDYFSLIKLYKVIDFLNTQIDKYELLMQIKRSPKSSQPENVRKNINRFPDLFISPYACELFFYTMENLSYNNNKRLFSIYWRIFQKRNLAHSGRLDTAYQKFILSVFDKTITKVEKVERSTLKEEAYFQENKKIFDDIIT